MNTETSEPIIQDITTPSARRVIVKYSANVNVGNYSSFGAEAMMVIDLPPDTPPPDATIEATTAWRNLHEHFGDQFAEIASEARDNWQFIESIPKPMQPLITVIKTIWGNIAPRINRKG